MNPLFRPAFLLLAFGVGAVGGWLIRGAGVKSKAEPQQIVSMTAPTQAADGKAAPPSAAARTENLRRLMRQITQASDDAPTPEFFEFIRRIEPCSAGELVTMLETYFADAEGMGGEGKDGAVDFSEDGAGAVVGTLLQRLMELDAAAGVRIILANEERVEEADCGGWVFATLARSNRSALRSLMEKLQSSDLRDGARSAWIDLLSMEDPAEAVNSVNAWRTGDPAADVDEAHAEQIGLAWARKDPAAAAVGVLTLTDAADRSAALDAVLGRWMHAAPDAARQWALGLSGAQAGEVLAKVLFNDPAKEARAGELAAGFSGLRDPGEGFANYVPLAREIVRRLPDPDKAMTFIDGLPVGQAREAATEELAGSWVRQDAAAASAWIARLPDGGAKNVGIEALVDSVHEEDPAGAFAWAQKHTEENARLSLLTTALHTWNREDPSAAEAALATLPAAVAAQIRKRLEHRLEEVSRP